MIIHANGGLFVRNIIMWFVVIVCIAIVVAFT